MAGFDFRLEVPHILEEKHVRLERGHKENVLQEERIANVYGVVVLVCMHALLAEAADFPASDTTKSLARRATKHYTHTSTGVGVKLSELAENDFARENRVSQFVSARSPSRP